MNFRFKITSMKQKMIVGFSALYVLSLILIYKGLYTNTVDAMRRKTEDSTIAVSKQIAQQIDKSFDHMVTISHIFTSNRRNRELLNLNGLSYLEQLQNYWLLQESMTTLSSYFTDYHVAVFLPQDSLIAKDRVRFFGDALNVEGSWVDEALLKKGGLYWTEDSNVEDVNRQVDPAISAFQIIDTPSLSGQDAKFFRTSITYQALQSIFSTSTDSLPSSYYILNSQNEVVLTSHNALEINAEQTAELADRLVINHEQYHTHYDVLPTNGWQLLTIVPDSYYNDSILSTKLFFLALVSLLFLAFVSVMLTIWRSFGLRVNRIIQVLTDVEQEDYSQKLVLAEDDELSLIEIKVNDFIDKIQILMKNIIRVEEEKKESELISLQSQIKPHFLYNTLDSINWMALDKGHYEISSAIVDLADFIRKSLSTSEDYVLVRDELEHVRLYINIMNERSECHIQFQEELCDTLLNSQTIKFLLQPIVENSIIHGFNKNHRRYGNITMNGNINGDQAFITIIDDGDGFDNVDGSKRMLGYGLRNVEYRLKLFYGDSSNLHISSQLGLGTTVTLSWPIK